VGLRLAQGRPFVKKEIPCMKTTRSIFKTLDAQWIVGFVDGEGCFSLEESKHQFLASFTVVQHKRNVHVLYALKAFFQVGVVRSNTASCWCWRVRKHEHLVKIIIPFFQNHRLKTTKRIDFVKFAYAVHLIGQKKHLHEDGKNQLRTLKNTMNTTGRRKIESNPT
jgi:hypothetical protein